MVLFSGIQTFLGMTFFDRGNQQFSFSYISLRVMLNIHIDIPLYVQESKPHGRGLDWKNKFEHQDMDDI